MNVLQMFSYPFMQRALAAGVLVSLCAALLGVPLVLKRYSMIGDGLSHVSFGALAIAVALGVTPLYFSIPVVILAAFFLLRMASHPHWNSDAAIAAGFDIFTCATNHTMDMGSAGVEKELEYFGKHKEAVHLGTNASQADYDKITYYEKNNITFALLNYTYGTNGIDLPKDKPWLVNLMDKDKIRKDITEARKHADVVMVFPHWGTENSHKVSDYQKEYTKLFSDLGVDIVIGSHPHVLQPVAWVTNEKSGKKMLVYYSLGNFISHQINLPQLCGGMAEVTIEKDNGKITISSAKLAPVVCHYSRGGNGFVFSVYKLSDYTDELAATQAQKGATVKYFTDLSKKVIPAEFLDI